MTTTNASSRAAAGGSLKDRPFPRLLQQAFRKHVTGHLVVTDDSADVTHIFLRDGLPVHVERPDDIDRLDKLLVERGLITTAQSADAGRVVEATGRRLGDVLVMQGLITREELADVLKSQVRRKVTRLFFVRTGSFEIFIDPHPYGAGDDFEPMRVDPRVILLPGMRAAYGEERVRDELELLMGQRFRLGDVSERALGAMGFSLDDPTVTSLKTEWLTLDDVLLRMPGKLVDVGTVVLALRYADLLDLEATTSRIPANAFSTLDMPMPGALAGAGTPVEQNPQPPSGRSTAAPAHEPAVPKDPMAKKSSGRRVILSAGARRPTPDVVSVPQTTAPAKLEDRSPVAMTAGHAQQPAAPPSALDENLRAALLDFSGRLERISYFELLGVSAKASTDEINAAYLRLVRRFHPDRLAAAGLRELQPEAERLVARLGEAAAALRDAKQRAAYGAARAGKPAEPSPVAIVEAETTFRKGELFLKQGDYARAVEVLAAAVKLNPGEPYYRAHLAWARFEDPRARKEILARETLAAVDELLRDRPRFARGHYWAGQIWKYLNEPHRAEQAFREAVNVDQSFMEAKREARLIEMRLRRATEARSVGTGASTPASAARSDGLFYRLFRRDK